MSSDDKNITNIHSFKRRLKKDKRQLNGASAYRDAPRKSSRGFAYKIGVVLQFAVVIFLVYYFLRSCEGIIHR